MIKAKNISYAIRSKEILNDVSASFESGKLSVILGPNGAGKSTFLHCLAGTHAPSAGDISIDGIDINAYALDDLSKKRAVLSQANKIEFPFTAYEIVMMGRFPFNKESNAQLNDEIATKALQIFDSEHLKDRRFPSLSGGEQQRIHLARVQAQLWGTQDSYLLLDEPTAALDLKHQYLLMKQAKKLAQDNNYAVIMVLHDLNLALNFADEIIFLKDGRLYPYESPIDHQLIADIYDIDQKDAKNIF